MGYRIVLFGSLFLKEMHILKELNFIEMIMELRGRMLQVQGVLNLMVCVFYFSISGYSQHTQVDVPRFAKDTLSFRDWVALGRLSSIAQGVKIIEFSVSKTGEVTHASVKNLMPIDDLDLAADKDSVDQSILRNLRFIPVKNDTRLSIKLYTMGHSPIILNELSEFYACYASTIRILYHNEKNTYFQDTESEVFVHNGVLNLRPVLIAALE